MAPSIGNRHHATCLSGAFLRAHQRIKEKAAKVKKTVRLSLSGRITKITCKRKLFPIYRRLHVKKTVIYQ
jgi:hypothetical protein